MRLVFALLCVAAILAWICADIIVNYMERGEGLGKWMKRQWTKFKTQL